MQVSIPVSVGELVDKITILEIKKKKMNGNSNVEKELEKLLVIYKTLNISLELSTQKQALEQVNQLLWDIEDGKRRKEQEKCFDEEFIQLARNVYIFNDKRAKIKWEINLLTNSDIIEEKQHNYSQPQPQPQLRKAFFLGHLGLGDHILCNGLVRSLSEKYEEVMVVCKKQNEYNIRMMYSDNKKIKFYPVNTDSDISPTFGCSKDVFEKVTKGYDIFANGLHCQRPTDDFPYCFYDDVGIDRSCLFENFYIESFYKESLPKISTSYVFVHNTCSFGKVFNTQAVMKHLNLPENILIINPCINEYTPEHKYYSLAQEFVGKPIFYYINTICEANAVILSDSSFLCLSINLPIKTSECFYHLKRQDDTYFSKLQPHKNKPIFKLIL